MTKFERIRQYLNDWWGFSLEKNMPDRATGYVNGSWKTGYTVTGSLRGYFCIRYNTLNEIEESWLFDDNTCDVTGGKNKMSRKGVTLAGQEV